MLCAQAQPEGQQAAGLAGTGRASSHERELVERIRWFISLRWGAVVGMPAVTALARWGLDIELPVRPLFILAGVIAGYNLVLLALERWASGIALHLRHPVASALANFQMSADLGALASAIHFAGGVENPFAFFFLFHIIIASILLTPRATALQVVLAVVLFANVALGECYGVLPHYHLARVAPEDLYTQAMFVWAMVGVFGVTLGGVAYLATSITGRLRQREEEVLALTAQLERNAADLQAAYDKVSDTEQAKSRYMRRVSHELRAPLGAVQSSLRVILEGITGELPGKAREMMTRAELRLSSLMRVVSDLLTLSRSREAKLAGEMVPVPLQETLQRVALLQRPRAEAEGVELLLELPADLPRVTGEPESIEQLFTNLVGNAIKYTPAGGQVRVTAVAGSGEQGTESRKERAVASEDHGAGPSSALRPLSWVEVTVHDTGIGIPAADLPRVFEDFYRSARAREFAPVGTGLGLSIAKSIVEAHHGQIAVESAPGRGTTLRVRLPTGAPFADPSSNGRPARAAGARQEQTAGPPSHHRASEESSQT